MIPPRASTDPRPRPHASPQCFPFLPGRDSVLVGGVSTGSAVTSKAWAARAGSERLINMFARCQP